MLSGAFRWVSWPVVLAAVLAVAIVALIVVSVREGYADGAGAGRKGPGRGKRPGRGERRAGMQGRGMQGRGLMGESLPSSAPPGQVTGLVTSAPPQ